MNTPDKSKQPGTAIVTGASAGIGLVYAKRLAARGYDLILVARRSDRLDILATELRERFGVRVTPIKADLSNLDQLDSLVGRIEADETLTFLVNNAGTSTLALVADTSFAAIEAMNDLNIRALVRLSRAVLTGFKARNHGVIVNIGSVLGFRSLPISTVYSATKAYVLMFTRGLQAELTGTKVVIQLVAPAATATDIWEISGVPLTALDPSTVMTVDDMVDAALAGLDMGETLTMPSVESPGSLIDSYDAAGLDLLSASQNSAPASRYAR
ncbi:SDR family NAD(P)-dependent oxidoreductase (plasmid) [Lichenicola cladoniae]|uniref:NADP-dependent 3-hydroxy acid dehydrogenase YdfG n=1 Tax=Lichenicola cladoniae TaxID=1484109 RepID=A0A6M8HYG2_9PROT|nr:SDR family NAD(P)-dependent oxidoreductase [Lichenicola cladoniae]NPD70324.1 SDR family NAD(P)-dependent oxidoreductase [Acetobacteraceae bacterium]QKE93380.1 SDR family NAD(P)-dependent oxidoreductase [Lichenicola cladoniae]